MANYEIFDYLDDMIADYTTTEFSSGIPPQSVIWSDGGNNVVINEADDGSEERIVVSEKMVFYITVQYKNLSRSDHGDLMDFFFNSDKACGLKRSFYWTNITDGPVYPTDTHTYVCRFTSRFYIVKQVNDVFGTLNVRMKVLGRKAE